MSSYYSMYSYGVPDSTNKTYNFLVNGNSDYPNSSGLIMQANGSQSQYHQDSSKNAFVDLQSSSNSNSINIRYTGNGNTFSSMLKMLPDTSSSSSVYGLTVNGRMAGSQLRSSGDVRNINKQGLMMGQNDIGGAVFQSANDTPGFTFQSYNSSGILQNTNMVLNPNGTISTPYYSQTNNTGDYESGAIATFDMSGNLQRGWGQNQRLRTAESNLSTIYTDYSVGLPNKINELVNHLNSLTMYSTNLAEQLSQHVRNREAHDL